MKTIKGDNFITRYDDDKKILYCIFGAVATNETTAQMYMAIARIVREIDLEQLQGIQFDLRRVETFSRDNLAAMQRESFRFNSRHEISHIPIAFVVNTEMQEQIANLVIQMTPDKNRSEIVFSTAESYAFFIDWHNAGNART